MPVTLTVPTTKINTHTRAQPTSATSTTNPHPAVVIHSDGQQTNHPAVTPRRPATRPLRELPGVELRLHETILYNSIYHADDQLLINPHVHGTPAANAPLLHLRRVPGGDMVTMYLDSFTRVCTSLGPRHPSPIKEPTMPDTTPPPGGRPGRIDYYNDPNAPKATTIVPSVNVIVENDKSEILLIQRSDNGNWALPGGAIDIGESLTQAAIREVQEETGITCRITGLVGIYTDPKHIILYTSNNEARQEFSVVLTAVPVSGVLAGSSESLDARWVSTAKLSTYSMDRSMALRVSHSVAGAHGMPRIN
jgi:ADP-ribose pyrophosphatase YjhB (NUDIX family)